MRKTVMGFFVSLTILVGAQTNSTIHEAAQKGSVEDVKKYLESGSGVNEKDKNGQTPLYFAANGAVAELLLSRGADVNARDKYGWTPLIAAMGFQTKGESMIFVAKNGGANDQAAPTVVLPNKAGIKVREDVAVLLISKGADINARDRDGWTALHWAQSKAVAELLIAHGVDVNTKDDDGHTPLHAASCFGQSDVVEVLLSHGADVKATDYMGMTPLFGAALMGQTNVAELMIAKGADVNAKDNAGWTPLRWAEQRGHADMVALLKKHGGIGLPNFSPGTDQGNSSQVVQEQIIAFKVLKSWIPGRSGTGLAILVSPNSTQEEVLALAKFLVDKYRPQGQFMALIFDSKEAWDSQDKKNFLQTEFFKHKLVSIIAPLVGSFQAQEIVWTAVNRDEPKR